MAHGYEVVVTMDGDGQHHTGDLDRLIEKCGKYDYVIGARSFDCPAMPLHRKLSNRLTSFLISRALGISIPDTQCGFRCVKTALIRKISLDTDGYEMETELIIKSVREGFTIASVPVKTLYNGSESSIRCFRDTWRVARTYFKYL